MTRVVEKERFFFLKKSKIKTKWHVLLKKKIFFLKKSLTASSFSFFLFLLWKLCWKKRQHWLFSTFKLKQYVAFFQIAQFLRTLDTIQKHTYAVFVEKDAWTHLHEGQLTRKKLLLCTMHTPGARRRNVSPAAWTQMNAADKSKRG